MFKEYYSEIDHFNFPNGDKEKLKNSLELLDKYKYEQDKLVGFTHEELRNIFETAKFNPKLQIEIWCSLPQELVDNSENTEIFGDVLENKFGEYIRGIDKNSLVKLLNSSRYPSRSNG